MQSRIKGVGVLVVLASLGFVVLLFSLIATSRQTCLCPPVKGTAFSKCESKTEFQSGTALSLVDNTTRGWSPDHKEAAFLGFIVSRFRGVVCPMDASAYEFLRVNGFDMQIKLWPAGPEFDCETVIALNMEGFMYQAFHNLRIGGIGMVVWETTKDSRELREKFIDSRMFDEILWADYGGFRWHIMARVPEFPNPTMAHFNLDRAKADYAAGPRSKYAFAFVVTVPHNMEPKILKQFHATVHHLRRTEPYDVCVFLVLTTPGGVKWKRGEAEKWHEKNAPALEDLKRSLTTIGARVFVREKLPQRPQDDVMYYQFDYQKLYVWNLRYEKVAFFDADIIVNKQAGLVFDYCLYELCGVQEPANYGGYMNNGVFVVKPSEASANALIEAWWKKNPPYRLICLQDLLNEVYATRWRPMPEAFNFQGFKHGMYFQDACNAVLVHFKDCDKIDYVAPACRALQSQMKAMSDEFPNLLPETTSSAASSSSEKPAARTQDVSGNDDDKQHSSLRQSAKQELRQQEESKSQSATPTTTASPR